MHSTHLTGSDCFPDVDLVSPVAFVDFSLFIVVVVVVVSVFCMVDFVIKNSVSFLGDGCGVIMPGNDFGLSITLVDIVVISLVDNTGCFDENITTGDKSSFIEGGGVLSLFFPCLAASNASKSFWEVNVVTLLSIGVVGGVNSCG